MTRGAALDKEIIGTNRFAVWHLFPAAIDHMLRWIRPWHAQVLRPFRSRPSHLPSSILQAHRNMASSSALNVERFLADKRTPFCGLDCAKAFEQLRYPTSHSFPYLLCTIDRCLAQRKRNTRITSPKRAGQVLGLFKINGHRRQLRSTTSSFSPGRTKGNSQI